MRFPAAFFILIFGFLNLSAQDAGFSQFFANPLYLNPAFAGTTELPRFTTSYRNQWPRMGNTYTTYSVSYDSHIKNSSAGLGVQIMHDTELNGVVNSSSASVIYSHHIKLGYESFMTLGLQSSLFFKQFNLKNLIFPSGTDQLTGEIYEYLPAQYSGEKKLYPDFAVGAMGQHDEYFWGVSVHHITRPDESIIKGDHKGRVPVKATVHAGAKLHRLHYGLLSRAFTLSPNILYQQQGSFKQLNFGVYMLEKSFQIGGWYRNNLDIRPDALIIMAGFAKEKFQIGYSFDITLSKMSNYSYGSHEISLILYLKRKQEAPVRDKLLIPSI